jgi:hypothetical protein
MRERAGDHDDDSLAAAVVPKLVPCDVRKLALGRHDGFLLSQIDGHSSIEDLASLTGLPQTEVSKIVVRLHGLGAVSIPGRSSARKTKAPPSAPSSSKPLSRRSSLPPERRSRPPSKSEAPKSRRPERRSRPPSKSEAPKSSLPPERRSRPPSKSEAPKSIRPDRRSRPPTLSEGPKSSPPKALPPDCVPRLTSKSQRPLQIDMKDAYVLAQVDGSKSLGELTAIAGFDLHALTRSLYRLERAGAVALSPPTKEEGRSGAKGRAGLYVEEVFSRPHGKAKPAPRTPSEPPSSREPAPRSVRSRTLAPPKAPASSHEAAPRSVRPRTVAPPRVSASSHEAAPRSVRPRTVAPPKPVVDDSVCELDAEVQAKITGLHAMLTTATHYELLGVARDVDKKVIKNAYFGYVATLHPDRHFRKKLGPLKRKLDEIFIRLTTAHEALSRSATRAEYDRTLPPLPRPAVAPATVSIAAKPDEAPVTQRTPQAPPSVDPRSFSGSAGRIKIPAFEAGPLSGPVRIAAATTGEPRGSVGPSSASAVVSMPPSVPAPRSSGVRPVRDGAGGVDPADPLRRFFADKVKNEGRQRARVFAEAGEYELSRGNLIAAQTNFQLAIECCDDPELRLALAAVEGRAQAQRFDLNVTRAESAERDSRWAEAVTCYTKAHAAKPESRVAERLANAIRMEAGDLRQAAKLAEEAVQQEPKNAAYRITLGEVYADAGLALRAEGEAKRAIELAPKDPRALALMDRVTKTARAR